MAGDIVLTAGVRSNLLNLQKTADLITSTQTKLATGKRVNTALDNPINFFTAQGLTNRANDLANLLDSMAPAERRKVAAVFDGPPLSILLVTWSTQYSCPPNGKMIMNGGIAPEPMSRSAASRTP